MEGYHFALGEESLSNDTRRRYPHDQAKYFEPTTTTEDFFEADYSGEVTDTPEDPDTVNIGRCYCNGECSPRGVINITACRFGAPGFVSLPHFLKGDPVLVNQVSGLKPDEEKHSFYLTLEPVGIYSTLYLYHSTLTRCGAVGSLYLWCSDDQWAYIVCNCCTCRAH